ncbi:MAG: IPTL-CTERM sorting domain-containing protein [Thermodesulfobacteriota bacterium]
MKTINTILVATLFLVLTSSILTLTANAQCDVVDTLPGGGQLVECNGNDNNGLQTTTLNDIVNMNQGSSITGPDFISLSAGDDILNMNGATIMLGPSINLSTGNDTMNVLDGSKIINTSGCINAASEDDTIIIDNAVLECGSAGVNGAAGNDIVELSNTTFTISNQGAHAVTTSNDDDQITIGNRVLLVTNDAQSIDCGTGDDTLTFAMNVPAEQLASISAEIAAADPQAGSITINGYFYSWERCDELVNALNTGPKNVPTLSQWGLITLAALIGIFAVVVAKRRFQKN